MSNSLLLGKQVLCSGEPGTLDHLFDALTNQKAVNGSASLVIAALENRYRVTDQSPKLDAGTSVELFDGDTVLRSGAVQPHSNLLRFGVALAHSHDMDVPPDWIVMTSTRPLLGHKREEGAPFLRGRFRAAIDPTDSLAETYIEENRKLAGYVIVQCSREEMLSMALAGSRYADKYLDQFVCEELWDVLQPQVEGLNKLDYGSVLMKLNGIKGSDLFAQVSGSLNKMAADAEAGAEQVGRDQPAVDTLAQQQIQGETPVAATGDGASKAEPIKWFGSEEKASAYIAKAGLTETHHWLKNERRFEIFKNVDQGQSQQVKEAVKQAPGAATEPMPVSSYKEAQQWVDERAVALGMSKDSYFATDEYDALYPTLEKLYQKMQIETQQGIARAGQSSRANRDASLYR